MTFLVAAVLTTSELGEAVSADPQNDGEVTYPASGAEAIEQFRATGTVTLQVPHDPQLAPAGQLTVTAREENIFADRGLTAIGGETLEVIGQIESVAIEGTVPGHFASKVTLLLDPIGIYGTIAVREGNAFAEFTFNPLQEDSSDYDSPFAQHVRLKWTDAS